MEHAYPFGFQFKSLAELPIVQGAATFLSPLLGCRFILQKMTLRDAFLQMTLRFC